VNTALLFPTAVQSAEMDTFFGWSIDPVCASPMLHPSGWFYSERFSRNNHNVVDACPTLPLQAKDLFMNNAALINAPQAGFGGFQNRINLSN